MSVIDVVNNGFCIGCGNCTFISSSIFRVGEGGQVSALPEHEIMELKPDLLDKASRVCPFSGESTSEDVLADRYYSDSGSYDVNIGYYRGVYVGSDSNSQARVNSSSGGVTTKLIAEMLARGMVDAAIVVSYDESSSSGVSYRIANSEEELESSRQSKYILAGYGDLIQTVARSDRRFVFVGVPCHVKAFRLLTEQFPDLSARVLHYIAIFCGHQKSSAFRDYIGWQLGVHPDNLNKLVYRVKREGFKAHEYFYRAIDKANKVHEAEVSTLKWMDWGLGLFKLKACDYCDDVAGEVADVILGDAWMKPYSSDYRGNNLIVTRSSVVDDLLNEMAGKGSISLNVHGVDAVFQSQGANFRHRKEGLLSRIHEAGKLNVWIPSKRESLYKNFSINPSRHALYVKRERVSQLSHRAFAAAVDKGNIDRFFDEMSSSVSDYQREYKSDLSVMQRVKGLVKRFIKGARLA